MNLRSSTIHSSSPTYLVNETICFLLIFNSFDL